MTKQHSDDLLMNSKSSCICPLCKSTECHDIGIKNEYIIISCETCGLRFVKNMPTLYELGTFYSKNYGNKKDERNVKRKVLRWYLKLLPLKILINSGSLLDLGCNTGFAVEAARKLGFQSIGYDLSEQAIAIARKSFTKNTYHCGTANDAILENKQYDVVICAEMIEHLTELDELSKALSSLVRLGGILYLTTPQLDSKNGALLLRSDVCPPEHLIYFGKQQLEQFLRQAGFKVLFHAPVLNKNSIRVFARRVRSNSIVGISS